MWIVLYTILMLNKFKTIKKAERFSTRRMESLSDGVFGCAMTLLVLDIVVPTITTIRTDGELLQALLSQQRAFISFVIAFFILAAMWGLHVRQFEKLENIDRRFLLINNIRLLLAILVAFSTSIAANYEHLITARMILPVNFLLLALVGSWQWHYAVYSKPPLLTGITEQEKRMHNIRAVWFILFSLTVVAGAYFVGELAFAVFLLMPVVIRLTARVEKVRETTE